MKDKQINTRSLPVKKKQTKVFLKATLNDNTYIKQALRSTVY